MLIGPLDTNFNEILIGIQTLSFKEMHFKMSSGTWRQFCLSLDVLIVNMAMAEIEEKNLTDGHVDIRLEWNNFLYFQISLLSYTQRFTLLATHSV